MQKLVIFERKILRKIFGPTKESNGLWRIKTNEELGDLIQQQNAIRFTKSQQLKWLGHVKRMPQGTEVTIIYKWKPFAIDQKEDQRLDGKMTYERICRQ
jgi:hypothetical protein